MPTLEGTYYPGATLDLYAWQQPDPPISTEVKYTFKDGPRIPTQLSERYKKSIAERVALPSTPPTVSITLERRMDSSMSRVPHVWTARVLAGATTYPSHLVAKIYDPVFSDDEEAGHDDPFHLRDLCISCEVESYRRLEPLYGTQVPRFYGYFAAMVPDQDSRTVFVLLLEEVPGRDIRTIVPPDDANKVCPKHKEAIIDAALRLFYDVRACGVSQVDMTPRNVILRPQKHGLLSMPEARFCDSEECPVALDVDCDDLDMVMVDFEVVDFKEPDPKFGEPAVQKECMEAIICLELKYYMLAIAVGRVDEREFQWTGITALD
ncbi:hypothetical protein NP233_g7032 [Leucocoprinus birnbaumii]|uniref:Protein kinase domain-containing protein n=1 Tax=Leucocoprinus birnbaumii TaxID=56174 RepID=A0AAD5YQE0_9AGAR|nr:hypothetical protein NP233_g7032 [Leucocoprinus birnbaumii]